MRSRLSCRRASSSWVLRLRERGCSCRAEKRRENAQAEPTKTYWTVSVSSGKPFEYTGARQIPCPSTHTVPVASNKVVWREEIGPFSSQKLQALGVQGPLRSLFSVVPKIGRCRDVETRSQAACDSMCILIWRGQSRAVVGGARRRTTTPAERLGGSDQCWLGMPTTSSVGAAVCGKRRPRVPQ